MEVFATGYHLSAMKLKQVRVCPTCTAQHIHFITPQLQVECWTHYQEIESLTFDQIAISGYYLQGSLSVNRLSV